MQVEPYLYDAQQIVREAWENTPDLPMHSYYDTYGNRCQRLVLPIGEYVLRYDALVKVVDTFDEFAPEAVQHPVEDLPDEVLMYMLPSRVIV
jgi:hypothetical protein